MNQRGKGVLKILSLPRRSSNSPHFTERPISQGTVGRQCQLLTRSYVIKNNLFNSVVSVLCFYLLGPEEDQKKVEPHHTVVFEDGDCIKVENKVEMHKYFFFFIYTVVHFIYLF